MTEILHNQLADFIKKATGKALPGTFLIHGQEMLVEQAVEILVGKLLDGASRDLCCESVDGLTENIPAALARMNTFALLSGPKIVLFKEARLLEGRGSHQELVERIVAAWSDQDPDQAARALVHLCGHLEIDLEAVPGNPAGNDILKGLQDQLGPESLDKIVQHGLAQGLRPVGGSDQVAALQKAIEKGFADHHHLLITVGAKVPKNLKLYKSIRDHGWIVDCHVPMGERKADRAAQESVLRQTLETTLAGSGKRLQGGLFQSLCQLTGFDLRTFAQNLEKLIDYTGDRPEITSEDVQHVLQRTRNDPIFELTNAVADRNLAQSLFYLQTLLGADWYPLQILTALANQVRRLLVAKDFAGSSQGRRWSAAMSYQQFQHGMMPAIEDFDRQVGDQVEQWQASAPTQDKAKSGGAKKGADMALAPNPKNSYPVYQTLLKSEKYSRDELLDALVLLNRTDLRLKSTGQDTAIVLKKAIIDICRRP
jgi:DNA polymerase III subunit delta